MAKDRGLGIIGDVMNPLIIQSDRTVLAETDSLLYAEARDRLCRFAELVKSPEHVHTYRITDLSLWNAAATDMAIADILGTLTFYARYPVSESLLAELERVYKRYGLLELQKSADARELLLVVREPFIFKQLTEDPQLSTLFCGRSGENALKVPTLQRGLLKQRLLKRGYPIQDLAGYADGDACPISLRSLARSGSAFALRDYQIEAVEAFHRSGSEQGGNGVIVLPCGSGKTMVGLGVLARLQTRTLIVVTSLASIHQWVREILDKTDLKPDDIGEYSGVKKEIKPVTLATYNILTHSVDGIHSSHFDLFNEANWGLVLYDEVHLLPAPVFRMAADLQARRRLGLTATLIREDGREDDVFALIGPRRYETPWKELENKGWIAEAVCQEIRVPMSQEDKYRYIVAEPRAKFRIAAESAAKVPVIEELLKRHSGEATLIIGNYLDQLKKVSDHFGLPLLTGQTSNKKREELYDDFRNGVSPVLVVSKVANFSIDLPDARVLIEIAGTFGSRQEEAQRLGRILRPKPGRAAAHFYTLVLADTDEQEFARHRQLFLTEQGYRYQIVKAAHPVETAPA